MRLAYEVKGKAPASPIDTFDSSSDALPPVLGGMSAVLLAELLVLESPIVGGEGVAPKDIVPSPLGMPVWETLTL